MKRIACFRVGTNISAVTKLIELPLYFSMDIAKIINLTLIKKNGRRSFIHT